jgi:hypothetical protein
LTREQAAPLAPTAPKRLESPITGNIIAEVREGEPRPFTPEPYLELTIKKGREVKDLGVRKAIVPKTEIMGGMVSPTTYPHRVIEARDVNSDNWYIVDMATTAEEAKGMLAKWQGWLRPELKVVPAPTVSRC